MPVQGPWRQTGGDKAVKSPGPLSPLLLQGPSQPLLVSSEFAPSLLPTQ